MSKGGPGRPVLFVFPSFWPVPPHYCERQATSLLLQETHVSGTSPRVPGFSSDMSEPTRKKESKMKRFSKYTAVLTGAIALAAATPSDARNGRNAAAIGFGVGAV